MARKFTRSCPKGGTCLVDVIITEYAVMRGEFTRSDILKDRSSLKLTPRQASYRLAYLVKNKTLTMTGVGRGAKYVITHAMNLNPAPFEAIKMGRKNVEMRLNDGKRQFIAVGDYICFTNTETCEELLVRVVGRAEYPSFEELYANYDKLSIGYKENEVADPRDMLLYYTEEKIAEFGALALTVKVI